MDEAGLVNTNGIIVCEHSFEVDLPQSVGRFKQVRHEKYGIIAITIFSRLSEE